MKRITTLFFTAVVLSCTPAFAQFKLNSANYFINPFVLNPAYAGSNEGQSLFFDVRKDMAGIDNGPSSQYVTYDFAPIPDKIGLGLSLQNESAGFISNHKGYVSFSYKATLGDEHFLGFGAKGGMIYRGINFDNLIAKHESESFLYANNKYSTVFDAGIGLQYYMKGFDASIMVNNLTAPQFTYTNSIVQNQITNTQQRNYMVMLGYEWDINEDFDLKPLVVLNSNHGLPLSYEGGAAAIWKKNIWLSALYKHDVGINLTAGFKAYEKLSLAYSYHYYSSALNRISHGSHEVIVGLSFIKSKSNKNKVNNDLDGTLRKNEILNEKNQILEEQNRLRNEEIELLKKELRAREKDSLVQKVQGMEKIEKFVEEHADTLAEEQKKIETPLLEVPSESENVVKELDDIDMGEYKVILGAFKDIEHAIAMQKILKREYEISTLIAKNRLSKKYPLLIYSKGCDTREDCSEELKKMQTIDTKNIIIGVPWLYKTHK
jgi:type IX secretion system PorP/SprF family membrane protein|tara:strand:- start:263 stop:1732 length:1470 start_codon:yes stop_codon:yes gene_type:complete